jgi:hypothetical protein
MPGRKPWTSKPELEWLTARMEAYKKAKAEKARQKVKRRRKKGQTKVLKRN